MKSRCKQKICPECGKEFELDMCWRKYCSKECSRKVIVKKNKVRSRECSRRQYGSYERWIGKLRGAGYHVIHKNEFERVLQTSIEIMKTKMEIRNESID